MDEMKCTSLVPLYTSESKKKKISFENYRRKRSRHILYVRLYLAFFFLGACIFASGKWNADFWCGKVNSFVLYSCSDFTEFCASFAPLIFSIFLVYASGFTLYATIVSVIFSSVAFFLCGITACVFIYTYGFSFTTLGMLALLGVICGMYILFCSATRGISEIAVTGIGKLSISDGILYTVLFLACVFVQYVVLRSMWALAL